MKTYLVVECRLSYAVVLDEDGRFLKVANRHYMVGQTVSDIIEMRLPRKRAVKWIASTAAAAACIVLMAASLLYMGQVPYASVYMTINPEVRIDVNRRDVVVGVDGVNADGDALIEGYRYKKKSLDLVLDELADRAIDQGYLSQGGRISLVLDADSQEWIVSHADHLPAHLSEHLNEKLTVVIDVTDLQHQSHQIVIPAQEKTDSESNYGESDYSESDYSESDYGESDYSESDYDRSDSVQTNHDDITDYARTDYRQTTYADSDYSQSKYGESRYDQSDYDGDSEYDSSAAGSDEDDDEDDD